MSQPEIYADLTFLVNFFMDFIIIWATVRLSGARLILSRLIAAALAGGVYAVGYLLPVPELLYTLPAKIFFSALLIIIGTAPRNWPEFKKALLYFYGISFIVAGATIASSYLFETGYGEVAFSYFWLLGGICAALGIGIYGGKYLKDRVLPGLLKFGVELRFGNSKCNGSGFLDTGNILKDPLTNKPVIVAEYQLLKSCLPQDFQQAVEINENEDKMLDDLIHSTWANRLRLIPFTSIGKKNGMLVGVRADEVVFNIGPKPIFHKNTVVGIYKECLSPEGGYQLLIPSEMVEG